MILCMRTSSKSDRTCFDIPNNFKSPLLALNCLRQESIAPSPELSTKRNALKSRTNLVFASSTGAMSRLKSLEFSAPNSSTGTVATATSPTFSTRISMRFPFTLWVPVFDYIDAVSAAFIAIVANFIHTSGDDEDAESGFARTIERRRGHFREVDRVSQVMQTDRKTA